MKQKLKLCSMKYRMFIYTDLHDNNNNNSVLTSHIFNLISGKNGAVKMALVIIGHMPNAKIEIKWYTDIKVSQTATQTL